MDGQAAFSRPNRGLGLRIVEGLVDRLAIRRGLGETEIVLFRGTRHTATVHGDRPAVVEVVGELDLSTVAHWEATVGRAARSTELVVLDVSRVEFLDSAGVHALFRMLTTLQSQRKRLVIVAPAGRPGAAADRDPRPPVARFGLRQPSRRPCSADAENGAGSRTATARLPIGRPGS